ncbi:alpha-galactosidase [Streptomyces sp. NPDC001380]|uniref:alpha-galactosidase n=1 Tax=Streptomyces sp. NPDC001380 TaxID=3364566 RepID=UPI0036BDF03F
MDAVTFDPATRTWLLRTANSSYALRLDDAGLLRHVHWGRPLTPAQAAAVPLREGPASSFDGAVREEYPSEGGARFGVPALQVRYADRGRGLQWRHTGHRIDGGTLALSFHDDHHPLELELHYRVHPDSDVVERWASLRHTAEAGTAQDTPVEVLRLDSACWTLPVLDDYRLSHVTGGWSGEFRLHRTPLPAAETTLTSRRGITSHQANPWLMVDGGDAGEEHGEVWGAALAWSGSWRITASRSHTGDVAVTGGAGHEGPAVVLRAGGTWETPVFAGLYTDGGFGAASRAWHRYTAGHVLPRPDELRPVVYNSWEAVQFDVTEEKQRELAARAAALGVELFTVDDGWFGARRSDAAGLGDWTPAPDRFPDGLGPLVAEVRRLGMRFGLWVEPEMVNPDSDLYRAHPDWVLHTAHRDRTELRNQLVLNFARPDVAEWALGWLDALVAEHRIDYLKWDMNRAFTEAGWPGAADPDRLWHDHVRGVHRVMDRLRAAHPDLRIEACAGGGGRVDLGVLARTDQVWTSDNTDAHDRLSIQHGYSQLYPARTMTAWVTDSPNPLTGRRLPLAFRFRVAMAGALGIGGDLLHWSPEELAEAARLVEEYKEIRPVVQQGELHRLRDAVQYTLGDRVVVVAWRLPSVYDGAVPAPLRPAGLDPQRRYRDEATGEVHHGAVLLAHGLPVRLAGDWASAVVRLTAVD